MNGLVSTNWFWVILILAGSLGATAQSVQVFEQIPAIEEATSSIVYDLMQDVDGHIWGATEEGVFKHNSQEVYLFNKYNGLPSDAPNRATCLFQDADAQIWLGTENGLLRFSEKDNQFEWIGDGATVQGATLIKSIKGTPDGHIWIGGYNGLWKYDPKSTSYKQIVANFPVTDLWVTEDKVVLVGLKGLKLVDFATNEVLNNPTSTNDIRQVFCVTRYLDNYLLGTKDGQIIILSSDFKFVKSIKLPGQPVIRGIATLPAKGIFVGTDGAGLFQLDDDFNVLSHYTSEVDNINSITINGIYDLLLDKEDFLWVATYGGGVNKTYLKPRPFENIIHLPNNKQSLLHNFTKTILEDERGRFWFGTKEGISVFQPNNNTWEHLAALSNDGKPSIVLSLLEDQNSIWVGTFGQGVFKINKSNLAITHWSAQIQSQLKQPLENVFSIQKDREGNIWIGGDLNHTVIVSATGAIKTYSYSLVRAMASGIDKGMFLGSKFGLIKAYADGFSEEFPALNPSKGAIDFTNITSIKEYAPGQLIIGTNGAGLVYFDYKKNEIQPLDISKTLLTDIIQGFELDKSDKLWVSTTKGIAQVSMSPQDTSIIIYDTRDGLASKEFNAGSYTALRDGRLAFGGTKGVTVINPSFVTENTFSPKVIFEYLTILNQKTSEEQAVKPKGIKAGSIINLQHSENSLNIDFVGVAHGAAAKVLYSWKMTDIQDEWIAPTYDSEVNLSNLNPGDYTFSIKASIDGSAWSEAQSIFIKVSPPWWRTSWAYCFYALAIGALTFGTYRASRILINKRNVEEQVSFFNNITHELKTPLTILLSNLESTAEDEQGLSSDKVKNTAERLKTLFDQLLNFNKVSSGHYQAKDVSKIELESYLTQIAQSFQPLIDAKKLSFKVDNQSSQPHFHYDQGALDKIMFNLTSNAIKYSKEGGSVAITVKNASDGQLQVSVMDNGIGIPEDQQKLILKRYYRGRNAINSQLPGTGLGLMIVKNLVEKDKGTISFQSKEREGTTFFVTIKDKVADFIPSPVAAIEEETIDASEVKAHQNAKILVVEDNDELRDLLVQRLSKYFQVYEAINGQLGLELARDIYPDLILTDLIMPEMDGRAMCEALKEDINLNHIPVFMMTVLNSSEQRLSSIESGVHTYMEKPIDMQFLMTKMIATLKTQKKLREKYVLEKDIKKAEKFRNERDAAFINDLEKFVLEKIKMESLSVYDLCKSVGMSRTALYMKLKNLIDLSPQNFIIHTRLKYARKLLMEGDVQVKEVAYEVGFANPKYFSTSFKKLFGESPTSFLKKLKNDPS